METAPRAREVRLDRRACLEILGILQTALDRRPAVGGRLGILIHTDGQAVHVSATEVREESRLPPGSVSWAHVMAVVRALVDETIAARPGRVYRDVLEVFERTVIHRALEVTGGRQLQAARLLGLNRNTVRSRCLHLGVHVSRASRAAAAGRAVR